MPSRAGNDAAGALQLACPLSIEGDLPVDKCKDCLY
jgi:hypothetical protein